MRILGTNNKACTEAVPAIQMFAGGRPGEGRYKPPVLEPSGSTQDCRNMLEQEEKIKRLQEQHDDLNNMYIQLDDQDSAARIEKPKLKRELDLLQREINMEKAKKREMIYGSAAQPGEPGVWGINNTDKVSKGGLLAGKSDFLQSEFQQIYDLFNQKDPVKPPDRYPDSYDQTESKSKYPNIDRNDQIREIQARIDHLDGIRKQIGSSNINEVKSIGREIRTLAQ